MQFLVTYFILSPSLNIREIDWKPDNEALTCGEAIRHVLEGEFLYHQILIARGSKAISNITNPFETKELSTVEDELNFAKPFREDFIKYIKTINKSDLENVKIDRSDVGYIRTLGDMLLRIAYHESVHTGQLLDYMRTMGIDRPQIWD
ncbi:DinB family protein [Peribacillus sp. NPDC060186]